MIPKVTISRKDYNCKNITANDTGIQPQISNTAKKKNYFEFEMHNVLASYGQFVMLRRKKEYSSRT